WLTTAPSGTSRLARAAAASSPRAIWRAISAAESMQRACNCRVPARPAAIEMTRATASRPTASSAVTMPRPGRLPDPSLIMMCFLPHGAGDPRRGGDGSVPTPGVPGSAPRGSDVEPGDEQDDRLDDRHQQLPEPVLLEDPDQRSGCGHRTHGAHRVLGGGHAALVPLGVGAVGLVLCGAVVGHRVLPPSRCRASAGAGPYIRTVVGN